MKRIGIIPLVILVTVVDVYFKSNESIIHSTELLYDINESIRKLLDSDTFEIEFD